jgi:predicted RNA-binding Zn ribbon-like protein
MAEPHPAPFFIGDDLALDFLNSIAAPWDREIEWLTNGGDLVSWLEQAHAVPEDVLAQFRGNESRALDAAASQARELREWFRRFVRKHAGKSLGPRALHELAPLNQLLGRGKAYRQIEVSVTGDRPKGDVGGELQALRWQTKRHWDSPKSLLLPIAEAMGDLVCQNDFTLVRKCEGPTCTLWFLDVSKGHGRRWCSMAVCGNRAKVAAHRARVRGDSGKAWQ